jgi:hypothetical protein
MVRCDAVSDLRQDDQGGWSGPWTGNWPGRRGLEEEARSRLASRVLTEPGDPATPSAAGDAEAALEAAGPGTATEAGRPAAAEEAGQAAVPDEADSPAPDAVEPCRVLVRLSSGERVTLAVAPDRAAAERAARAFIARVEDDPAEWPEVGRRLIRPGAIVSVDFRPA